MKKVIMATVIGFTLTGLVACSDDGNTKNLNATIKYELIEEEKFIPEFNKLQKDINTEEKVLLEGIWMLKREYRTFDDSKVDGSGIKFCPTSDFDTKYEVVEYMLIITDLDTNEVIEDFNSMSVGQINNMPLTDEITQYHNENELPQNIKIEIKDVKGVTKQENDAKKQAEIEKAYWEVSDVEDVKEFAAKVTSKIVFIETILSQKQELSYVVPIMEVTQELVDLGKTINSFNKEQQDILKPFYDKMLAFQTDGEASDIGEIGDCVSSLGFDLSYKSENTSYKIKEEILESANNYAQELITKYLE